MTYAFKYDAFKYDFTILDKQKCLNCCFSYKPLEKLTGNSRIPPSKSGLSVIQQMLYMRDDLNANKTIVFMVSTNIYIYLWWLVTATSTDLSHHLKYFYCVYFDGRPSNSCVIHLAGQDVLYLMQLYTISAQ